MESTRTKAPSFTNLMQEMMDGEDDPEKEGNDYRNKSSGINLVPDKCLNLQVLKGEQDPSNKISYAEWSRVFKDYIVAILGRTEQMNNTPATDKALMALGLLVSFIRA